MIQPKQIRIFLGFFSYCRNQQKSYLSSGVVRLRGFQSEIAGSHGMSACLRDRRSLIALFAHWIQPHLKPPSRVSM